MLKCSKSGAEKKHRLRGRHVCREDWRIFPEKDSQLKMSKLHRLIRQREPQTIDHQHIAWKSMHDPSAKQDARYVRCDIQIPGIVVRGAANPFNKPYRMIDGSHRMARMTLETEIVCSNFYVLDNNEFLSLLEDIPA